MSIVIKYGILSEYHDGEWAINLGKATYDEIGKDMNLAEAMNEVAKYGWQVVSVYVEEERVKCVVRHDDFK